MTLVHSNYILLQLIHSLIQSSSLAYGKRKLFPLCIYIYEQNRTKGGVLNPHTDWDDDNDERWIKKMLSFFLFYYRHSVTSPIFLFFPFHISVFTLPIGDHHRVPSASTKILVPYISLRIRIKKKLVK